MLFASYVLKSQQKLFRTAFNFLQYATFSPMRIMLIGERLEGISRNRTRALEAREAVMLNNQIRKEVLGRNLKIRGP